MAFAESIINATELSPDVLFSIFELFKVRRFEEAVTLAGSEETLKRNLEKFPILSKPFLDYLNYRQEFFNPDNFSRTVKYFGETFEADYSSEATHLHPGLASLSFEGIRLVVDTGSNPTLSPDLDAYDILLALCYKSYEDKLGEYILCRVRNYSHNAETYIKIYVRGHNRQRLTSTRFVMLAAACRDLRISVDLVIPLVEQYFPTSLL